MSHVHKSMYHVKTMSHWGDGGRHDHTSNVTGPRITWCLPGPAFGAILNNSLPSAPPTQLDEIQNYLLGKWHPRLVQYMPWPEGSLGLSSSMHMVWVALLNLHICTPDDQSLLCSEFVAPLSVKKTVSNTNMFCFCSSKP